VAGTGINYLGAHEISVELNADHPEIAAIAAARLFSKRLNDAIEEGKSLIVQSTLSGLSFKKFLMKATPRNFKISIFFVYLDSAELCVHRIASRVARRRHNIPTEDVRRRFTRSNLNFWNLYKHLADN
jgi:predicted ABC-type ATPase